MTRADLDKQPGDVAAMFDGIAERYDLLNDILSAGQVRLWRRAVAGSSARGRVTGCSTWRPAPARPPCRSPPPAPTAWPATSPWACCGRVSPSGGPDERGAGRLGLVAGDALRLPFRDEAFDAVTISFGLRNVASAGAALAEMRRVTRPGGRLVVCEFSTITIAPLDMLYRRYLINVLPAIAQRTARHPEAYQYLAESIADWPAQRELASVIEAAGWSAVRWRDLSLGVVAVHVARRAPEASGRPG